MKAFLQTTTQILSLLSIVLLLLACQEANKEAKSQQDNYTQLPLDQREGEVDPIASPNAVFGGTLNLWGGPAPKNLNYWINPSSGAAAVSGLLFEQLVSLHSIEDKPVGVLAESWEISDDKKSFIFKLNPKAKWSDGKEITSEDVQFYYDVIMDKSNMTPAFRASLSKFKRPIIIDSHTIKFEATSNHWQNFWSAAECSAFPKHLWKDKDFNEIKFDFDVVSGPYKISKLRKNRSVELERRSDWWGDNLAYNYGKFNFQKIKYKYMEDRVKTLEAFKKGDLDVYPIFTASIWMKQTNFEAVEKGWVNRERIYNKRPIGGQGFAINLREDKFKDIKIREALTLLLDRQKINDKFMYNQYFMLNSYFPDLYNGNQNPNIKIEDYQPEKARALFKDAGYQVNNRGQLEKDGKVFSISFLTAMEDLRHLEVYTSALKAIGVDAKIEKSNNPTIQKRLESFDFEMFWTAWGAGRLRDPEAKWHSKYSDEKNSINYPGFKNLAVDSLIELQKTEQSLSKRNEYMIEMDEILFRERPYVLLWNNDHNRLLSWNQYSRPKLPLGKFGDADEVITYWWLDSQKAKDLDNAQKTGKALEAFPSHTYWDKE